MSCLVECFVLEYIRLELHCVLSYSTCVSAYIVSCLVIDVSLLTEFWTRGYGTWLHNAYVCVCVRVYVCMCCFGLVIIALIRSSACGVYAMCCVRGHVCSMMTAPKVKGSTAAMAAALRNKLKQMEEDDDW